MIEKRLNQQTFLVPLESRTLESKGIKGQPRFTWRAEAEFLVRYGSPVGARGAGEHQLLVVQEGGEARRARQQEAGGLQRRLALRRRPVSGRGRKSSGVDDKNGLWTKNCTLYLERTGVLGHLHTELVRDGGAVVLQCDEAEVDEAGGVRRVPGGS